MTDPETPTPLLNVVAEFVAEINGAYGLYLDATAGFAENVKRVSASGSPDATTLFMGRGAPTDPKNVLQHQTTIGIYKARNKANGPNSHRLARYLVVMIYGLWETGYRARIATAAGLETDKLLVPVFGDLRRLRHAILHSRGELQAPDAAKLEVIAPPAGRKCDFSDSEVEDIVRLTKAGLDTVAVTHTGLDPAFRTIWHVE